MKNLFVVGSLHLDVIVKSPKIPQKDETIIGKSVEYVLVVKVAIKHWLLTKMVHLHSLPDAWALIALPNY